MKLIDQKVLWIRQGFEYHNGDSCRLMIAADCCSVWLCLYMINYMYMYWDFSSKMYNLTFIEIDEKALWIRPGFEYHLFGVFQLGKL